MNSQLTYILKQTVLATIVIAITLALPSCDATKLQSPALLTKEEQQTDIDDLTTDIGTLSVKGEQDQEINKFLVESKKEGIDIKQKTKFLVESLRLSLAHAKHETIKEI